MATDNEEEHQVLRNIATTGAKHILDAASEFPNWAERVLQDVGDQVRWIAVRTDQAPDAVLRQIYEHAERIAKLNTAT